MWEAEGGLTGNPPTSLGEAEKRVVLQSSSKACARRIKTPYCLRFVWIWKFFEGEKLILTTESDAVFKGLNRPDNANFISGALAELGVNEHEVRLAKRAKASTKKQLKN